MTRRVKVNSGLRNIKVPELITYSLTVYKNVSSSVILNSPILDLPAFDTAIKLLQKTTAAAYRGSVAAMAERNVNVNVVKAFIRKIAHHVEDVANDDMYAEDPGPETIVLSSGMKPKRFSPRQVQHFGVRHALLPGMVILKAAGFKGRGTHQWEYTLNPENENDWIAVDATVQAITMISDLQSGKRYYFRHCTIQKDGRDKWESPVSIIVL